AERRARGALERTFVPRPGAAPAGQDALAAAGGHDPPRARIAFGGGLRAGFRPYLARGGLDLLRDGVGRRLARPALARAGRAAPPLRARGPAEAVRAAWAAEIAQRGPVAAVGEPVSEPAGPGGVVVKIPVSFERGEVTVVISLAGGGWLTGIRLAPASAAEPAAPWQPPDYADPAAFDEQDVTVGSGPLAVPGTLSLPRQG